MNGLLVVVGALATVLGLVIWFLVWIGWSIVRWENRP